MIHVIAIEGENRPIVARISAEDFDELRSSWRRLKIDAGGITWQVAYHGMWESTIRRTIGQIAISQAPCIQEPLGI